MLARANRKRRFSNWLAVWLQARRRRRAASASPGLPLSPGITDLAVLGVGNTSVTVYWESVQSEAVEFVGLYRESPAGPWFEAGGGLTSDGGYMFEGLTSEVAYDFKLQTFGPSWGTEFDPVTRVDSNVVTETPGADIPDAPTDVHVGGGYVEDDIAYTGFAWTPPAGPVDMYIVGIVLEGSPMENPFVFYADNFTDPMTDAIPLAPDTEYKVAVKAVYNGQESEWSVVHQFTTPAA